MTYFIFMFVPWEIDYLKCTIGTEIQSISSCILNKVINLPILKINYVNMLKLSSLNRFIPFTNQFLLNDHYYTTKLNTCILNNNNNEKILNCVELMLLNSGWKTRKEANGIWLSFLWKCISLFSVVTENVARRPIPTSRILLTRVRLDKTTVKRS